VKIKSLKLVIMMVQQGAAHYLEFVFHHFCAVPCSNQSNWDTKLSYFGLLMKNKALLKV